MSLVAEGRSNRVQRIFLGDVQGCADELDDLVAKANSEYGEGFSLWITGDLVNRGPRNLHALEVVRALVEAGRGEYILGNHEIFLISVGLGLRELRPGDSIRDVLDGSDADDWIDWLRARPLVVPGVIDGQDFAMVHASTHPDWSLEELAETGAAVSERLSATREEARAFLASEPTPGSLRDHLGRLTRCRSVTPAGSWSSEQPESPNRAWHAAWAERGHTYGVVYGHWAIQGLHLAPGLRGLDTGCVHHGRDHDGFLTAWLPDSSKRRESLRAFDIPDDRIWQIPARRRYYDPDVSD